MCAARQGGYREQLCVRELAGYGADVVCLQEVSHEVFPPPPSPAHTYIDIRRSRTRHHPPIPSCSTQIHGHQEVSREVFPSLYMHSAAALCGAVVVVAAAHAFPCVSRMRALYTVFRGSGPRRAGGAWRGQVLHG